MKKNNVHFVVKQKSKNGRTFAKAKTQAVALSKAMYNSGRLASLGTSHSYEASLRLAAEWLKRNGRGSLVELTPKAAKQYLNERAALVGQKTLDRDRQALQAVLRATGRFSEKNRLPVIKAVKQQVLVSRNYTAEQWSLVIEHQTPRNALSTELAAAAGLRAHELFTLRPVEEQPMSDRPADPVKFRPGIRYTVIGKGGLIREVSIPNSLAARLEAHRLDEAVIRIDRKIHYTSHYDIGAGQAWSQSFTAASKAALDFSNGGHGLRHAYAQERHRELQVLLGDRDRAKQVVSQEVGHFRPEITDTYLR
ncbi:integrase [Pseudomonas sp. JUb42]|uniref:site-specific integrase n=1 Tax=Pseudomonas sp. JUb42 TaxID=2940611 RepID=UPI002167F6DE|nr:site-specific integrase [Pseudomonas sp. JUb42]MCS3471761.1 integrase [Pseudomonas sp. JUb42]